MYCHFSSIFVVDLTFFKLNGLWGQKKLSKIAEGLTHFDLCGFKYHFTYKIGLKLWTFFRFYFVMELNKIVLLPIPTGWRDSNSPMGDGLSSLNGFLQDLSLIYALFPAGSGCSQNGHLRTSLFIYLFINKKKGISQ